MAGWARSFPSGETTSCQASMFNWCYGRRGRENLLQLLEHYIRKIESFLQFKIYFIVTRIIYFPRRLVSRWLCQRCHFLTRIWQILKIGLCTMKVVEVVHFHVVIVFRRWIKTSFSGAFHSRRRIAVFWIIR